MKREHDGFRLSALDLTNHLACPHLTALERSVAAGEIEPPDYHDPRLQALWQRGSEHEMSFLEHLRSSGVAVVELDTAAEGTDAASATIEALRAGAEVVSQAVLRHGRWMGRADVLRRIDRVSDLGGWSYEVWDTKLARETRAGTLLQLCLYSALLATVQGVEPERAYVVPPGDGFVPETFRLADFGAYFRVVQRRLEAVTSAPAAATYPVPVTHCDVCRWWSGCDAQRRRDDHLSLVAGLGRGQLRELESWDVRTLAALAAEPLPLLRRPSRGVRETYEKLREQARVQHESRERGEPVFELLPVEPERGLCRLPEPSPGDLFLDFEGDPFAGAAGLEYLLGFVEIGADGEPVHRSRWALDAEAERAAFEWLVDEIERRRGVHPGLHLYHFTAYEPAAIKRLMGRYATREEEVDRFLRAGLFVDLHSILRQGVRAGVERYSLKELEPLYRFERTVPLREASRALRTVESELELRRAGGLDDELRRTVEEYNRDDCLSLVAQRRWLESLRPSRFEDGGEIPRPAVEDGEPSEQLDERLERVRGLAARLLEGIAADPELRDAGQQARWLAGHLLDWHRREDKVVYWEKLHLGELGEEERMESPAAVAGLTFLRRDGGTALCPIDHYRFPSQDVEIRDDELFADADTPVGSLVELDVVARTLSIKKRKDRRDFHPPSVFGFARISSKVLEESLERLGFWVAEHGIDAAGDHRAARDLLLRTPPRTAAAPGAPIRRPGEAPLEAARRLALELEGGVLPVQGPPGSGKTFTAARMIVELVKAGRRVGVTATSHQVIRNLLGKAAEAAREEGVPCRCVHRPSQQRPADAGAAEGSAIERIDDYGAMSEAIAAGAVAGGTAWMWAREELAGAVDVLFVDEAGQMSLANTLAVAQAARNLVLVGDPQQLEQPLRGSHPPGADVSALEHLLGGAQTVPEDCGLFLDETWRLHPAVCAFTSEQFYEGRLRSRNGLDRQELCAGPPFERSGLYYLPVEHEGNQSRSIEEAARIAALVGGWARNGASWIDCDGECRPLTLEDVLIVAPYNAQVAAIAERLPGSRVGTVDKFQGQEAPVVVYSMTTSSPGEAPRGMGFLFSRNRLNVATSRARCACVLVADPRLFEADCRTPAQMRLANALCRYRELATEISP